MSEETAVSSLKPLVEKLARVMKAVGHVTKRGYNTNQNYAYATEADVADEVRGKLADEGLILIPSVKSVSFREREGKNGTQTIATVMMDFTFTDGEHSLTYSMVGEGQDSGDKNTYKAMTGAQKYALMKFFLIPTGDDPEKSAEKRPAQNQDRRPSTPPRQNAPQTKPAPAGATQDGKTADGLDDEIRAKARDLAFRNGSNPGAEIEAASGFDLNGKWLKFSDPKGKSEKWRKSTLSRLLASLAASEPGADEGAVALSDSPDRVEGKADGFEDRDTEWLR